MIHDSVRDELLHAVSTQIPVIQIDELRLTLIELVHIPIRNRNTSMSFIHFHSKITLNMLNLKILSYAFQLIASVPVLRVRS